METKHTSRPWKMVNDFTVYTGAARNGARCYICTARSGATVAEDKANARLIAAAPDLLEALTEAKQTLETARRYFPKSIKNRDTFHLLNVLANAIDPAIALATGTA